MPLLFTIFLMNIQETLSIEIEKKDSHTNY